jgi:D-aminoacyl-tRNA deacylase
MALPSLFVEIGSDEAWYDDPASGQALAAAVTDVLDGNGHLDDGAPVLVGVGGGHYAPRHNDKALGGEADFGHIVPAYAVDAGDEDPSVLRRAVKATSGCNGVYVHKKGLKGPQRQRVQAWMEALGVELG